MPPLASFPVEPVASYGGASAIAGGNEGEERFEHAIDVFASAPSRALASRSRRCSPFEAIFDVSDVIQVSRYLAGASGASGDGSCATRARETFLGKIELSGLTLTHSLVNKLALPFIPSDTGFPSFAAPPVTTGGLWIAPAVPSSCDDAAATDAVVPRAVPVFDRDEFAEEQQAKPSAVAEAEPASAARASPRATPSRDDAHQEGPRGRHGGGRVRAARRRGHRL